MNILGFDHIVLCVRDVEVSLDFYERILGMTQRAERRGKWSLHFGSNKISLQDAAEIPAMARNISPGSGNFCLLTDTPIAKVVEHLRLNDIEIVEGPAEKAGATGQILSVYCRDPDQNLVEISNRLSEWSNL
jgi:catechol 2,3-dioxygenase-like lactoylglutathione lyase family enzyme